MPSIRRSLTLYLVLLVGGGLAVVAAVTDEMVGRTLEARRAAEAERVRAKLDEQVRVARERLDDELRADVRTVLAQLVGRFGFQNTLFFRVELPLAEALATPFPLAHAAWVVGPDRGPTRGGPAIGAAMQAHFAQVRVGEGILPPTDPAHPDTPPPLCLVTVTGRSEPLFQSAGLSAADFPPVPAAPDRAFEFDYTYDTLTIGGAEVRRVALKAPWLGGAPAPRPPNGRQGGGRPTPGDRPPRGDRPPGGGQQFPRLTIYYARPLAPLYEEISHHRQEMADGLTALEASIEHDRAALRLSLAVVASGTFLGILVGGPLLVRRGLRPVDRLSEAVGRVSEKDFRLPIEPMAVGRELLPVHDRLTHTLNALRRAFDREKQAVADISHELRTPVAGLQATLDVAVRKPRTAEQYKATIEESRVIVKQLGRLVERVLTLARLDAEAATKTVPTDLADLTAGCVAVVRPLAEAHGLTVTADLHPGLTAVTDPDQVREVVMNLLSNAVEYTAAGGAVGVSARPAAGAAVIEVRDTGIGMTPEVADRIFERFYRADPSRHATGAHAGLGLAIVKEAVAKLGGTVAVETTPGRGSTFRVRLPAPELAG